MDPTNSGPEPILLYQLCSMDCFDVERHLKICQECALDSALAIVSSHLEPDLAPLRLLGAGEPDLRSQLEPSCLGYDIIRFNFRGEDEVSMEGESDDDDDDPPEETGPQERPMCSDSCTDAEDHLFPRDSTMFPLLEGVAADLLRLYSCQIDLYHDSIDFAGDDSEGALDAAISKAAMLLARSRTLDLSLAARIVATIKGPAIPAWPPRAVANFILMNFRLIYDEIWLTPGSTPSECLWETWWQVVGSRVEEYFDSFCRNTTDGVELSNVTLRKAALLASSLKLSEMDTLTSVIAGLGPFTTPADGVAKAIQESVIDAVAEFLNTEAHSASIEGTTPNRREPTAILRRLLLRLDIVKDQPLVHQKAIQ
ncbi:hypothetical protein CC2G_013394 [Coprinopsis cinerea AmutBmut pab1-1]|nr:hypothetical protein CC2G_013394 [Coprinopsis cinerea AmutBmut pab1-1]